TEQARSNEQDAKQHALTARRNAEDAKQHAETARKNEIAAMAAKNDLEKANEALETTLARGLLRPLGVHAPPPGQPSVPLADAEFEALWELAESRSERLGYRFVEQAVSGPATTQQVTTRQLRNRAEWALHAAVGLNPRKRADVERVLGGRLQ